LIDLESNEGAESFDENIEPENRERYSRRSGTQPVVLHADDNRDLRQFVSHLLEPQYTVLLSQDGQQALEQARKYSPDLILSDLMMPRMSGVDFCQHVRKDVALKSIPFVLLTAKSSLEDRIDGLEDGADDYLSKPFSEQELLARIRNLVKMRQQQTEIKRQLQAARAIQQALLPAMKQSVGPLTIESLYRPCEELSGDFFDILSGKDWTYVYLVDVTSHGVASAQVTYLIKEMFAQALSEDPQMDLVSLFRRIRSSFVKHRLEYSVCLQLMRIHRETLMMENLRSGACFAISLTGSNDAEFLETKGSPLISAQLAGPDQDPGGEIFVNRIQLRPDQSIYIYTDGATEFPMVSGRDFGERRLSQVLRKHEGDGWLDPVMAELAAANLAPEGFPDDLTIVRVHVGSAIS
jgi:CheY-like chemotaxis protein